MFGGWSSLDAARGLSGIILERSSQKSETHGLVSEMVKQLVTSCKCTSLKSEVKNEIILVVFCGCS